MKKQLTVCFFGSYDRNFTSNKIVKQGLEKHGVNVVEVMSQVPVTTLIKPQDMGVFALAKRVVRKLGIIPAILKGWSQLNKSDVIYVGYPGHLDVYLAWVIAKLTGNKLVFNPCLLFYTGFVHDQAIVREGSLMARLIKWGEGTLYHLCDRVYADTPDQKQILIELFGLPSKKLEVLPIGADDAVYKFEGIGNQRDKYFNVMYYGLYSPLHATDVIMEAANIVRKTDKIRFVMVGNGNTYEATRKLAEKHKLTNVEFYPDMMEDTATDTLQRSDVFLGFIAKHPSVERIVPNKVYQGMALGKAVVTAQAPAIASILKQKEQVYMITPNDPQSLADAIMDLYNNPKLKHHIAQSGREVFMERFTPSAVGAQLQESLVHLLR